jgi:outer membrane protein OmpA-like peptidoglycan-associated protein
VLYRQFITGILLLTLLFNTLFTKQADAQVSFSFTVFFHSGSFIPTTEGEKKLSVFLKSFDTVLISNISIDGYCDDTGSKKYNDSLSLKRGNYIRDHLTAWGIKSPPLTGVQGKGELALIYSNNESPPKQRAFNRRAVITVQLTPNQNGANDYHSVPPASSAPNLREERGAFNNNGDPVQHDTTVDKNSVFANSQVGSKILLKNVLFSSGKHELLPSADSTLLPLAKELQIKTKYCITILGYVCCVAKGHDALDHDTGLNNLSEARAKAIYEYLIKNGIAANRLAFKGLKSDFPTGKADKYDRRVEFEITAIE